jgi:ATP phosphoribosyltransferase
MINNKNKPIAFAYIADETADDRSKWIFIGRVHADEDDAGSDWLGDKLCDMARKSESKKARTMMMGSCSLIVKWPHSENASIYLHLGD